MYSQSISKTIALALIATLALLVTAESNASAQEIFSGRGISGLVDGSSSSYSSPQPSNPLAGLFKKPAFLENLKLPTTGNNQSAGSGFLSSLPKLGNLLPQRAPGELSMLGKMKAKTDSFFAKASAFENLIPGRQQTTQEDASWGDVRQTMSEILASQAAERTASAVRGTVQR